MKKYGLFVLMISLCSVMGAQESLLEKYRGMALDYNYDLKSAEKNIRASMELERMANADFKPKLSGNGNFQYTGNPTALTLDLPVLDAPIAFEGKNMRYGAALSLVQPIYSGGRLLEKLRMAQYQQSLSKNQQRMIYSLVCYQTDMQYWNTVARAEIVTIASDFRNSVASLTETIRERVEVGLTDPQDLLMAEVKLNEADFQLLQAKNNFETGRMALNSMIGSELSAQTPVDITVPVVTANTLALHSDRTRPEIEIAHDQVKIAQSTLKINDSKYKPQVQIGAEGSYGSPGYDFKADMDPNYAVYAKLSVPIFEWGKRRSEKRLSSQKVGIAEDQLHKVTDQVELEVETARLSLNQALQRIRLSESSLEKARENEKKALERYNEGKSSILEVIDAQVYRLTSQLNYTQAKVNAQGNYAALLKALNEYEITE